MIDLRQGDCLEVMRTLPDESVNCIVTSPPYWGLRDYGHEGQIGLEQSFPDYLSKLIDVFDECRRVLKQDGTMWVNMGDSYASKWPCSRRSVIGSGSLENGRRENRPERTPFNLGDKQLIGQPWRLAFALQDAGWILRSDIIWHKPNPMPESVTDRPTRAHEYIFLLTKSAKYWYDANAIKSHSIVRGLTGRGVLSTGQTPHANARTDKQSGHGRRHEGFNDRYTAMTYSNARTVWTIATQGYPDAHFATFPEELPKRCILAGCPEGGTVLDIFAGSGTTLAIAIRLGRNAIGIELNPEYIELARQRIAAETPSLFTEAI